MIDRASGHIFHVWNSLCSNRHRLIVPSTCPASDSAIWARSGAVIEPGTGRILVATGNAPFNGTTNWGDSVLELSPDAGRLLHNWTPANQAQLNSSDTDLGSTAPALLPPTSGLRLAVQGGKEGNLALLNLDRLERHDRRREPPDRWRAAADRHARRRADVQRAGGLDELPAARTCLSPMTAGPACTCSRRRASAPDAGPRRTRRPAPVRCWPAGCCTSMTNRTGR